MDKKYYVWRDRQCNGVNPDWEEYTGPTFYEFIRRPENAGRRFIRLGNDVDQDAGIITIEATPEQYREWLLEEKRKSRIRKRSQAEESYYRTADWADPECICDEDTDGTEDMALDNLLEEQLLSALQHLSIAEQKLMELLYVKKLSLRETGKTMGIPYSTVQGRRDDVLRKLCKYL